MDAWNPLEGGRRGNRTPRSWPYDLRLGRVPYRPQASFSGRGGFERSTGWMMPPIDSISPTPDDSRPTTRPAAEAAEGPPRLNPQAAKYIVIAVVALTIGSAVWIVIDALPGAFEVDPGRAARRGGVAPAASIEAAD